jgi:hypothetical protein
MHNFKQVIKQLFYTKKMENNLYRNVWINHNIPYDILPVDLHRHFIEYTVIQQHDQQFTMVSSHGLLFRPSSDRELFKIKQKNYTIFIM